MDHLAELQANNLQELKDKGNIHNEYLLGQIIEGIDIVSSVLERTNSTINREELAAAYQDLASRVDDWKGHDVARFGELHLFGTYSVIKEGGSGKDPEVSLLFLQQHLAGEAWR